MKVIEIELIETQFKTIKKFEKAGSLRLQHRLLNVENKSCLVVLQEICHIVDCNFHEVLDAVNRTVR